MVPWRRRDLHPPPGGSGTGSRLLHYFSTTRVDSRGLRGTPVDSTAADKRLKSNVLDHKLRVVSQLPKHARTGSTPAVMLAGNWKSSRMVAHYSAGATAERGALPVEPGRGAALRAERDAMGRPEPLGLTDAARMTASVKSKYFRFCVATPPPLAVHRNRVVEVRTCQEGNVRHAHCYRRGRCSPQCQRCRCPRARLARYRHGIGVARVLVRQRRGCRECVRVPRLRGGGDVHGMPGRGVFERDDFR